ncbi:MAG: thiamine phosphate synthase [Vicinamibacterales bacterium]
MTRGPRPWLMVVSDRRRLCAAVARPLAAAPDLLAAQVRAAAAAGVDAFQVRELDLEGGALLALVERLAGAAGSAMRVVVNDRADVAAAAGVGVHLRVGSLPTARLRAWQPAPAFISRAAHDRDELAAVGPVDLVVAGTVRGTTSKGHEVEPIGFAGLRALAAAAAVPVIGIGGLSGGDWPALRAAGAVGFAAIGTFLPQTGESIDGAVARAVGAVVDSPGGGS